MNALAGVQNLTECDRSVQLEAIVRSGACEAGRVIMLDLAAVREKVGPRWNARCEAIWDHTERTIKRHVQSRAIFCRADQTSYVISFTQMDGFAAQALGFRIMEDVVTHFLGSCSPTDMIVKIVSDMSKTEITASPVSFLPEHRSFLPKLTEARPAEERSPMSRGFTPIIDGQLQQDFSVDSLYNLKLDNPIGVRVSSSFFQPITLRPLKSTEQASLATRQLLRADLNTLQFLRQLLHTTAPKLVIAPLSMQTFSHTMSRRAILENLQELDIETRSRFIVELYGLEDGTPTSRLAETITILKPFSRSVMARIMPTRSAISNVRAARLPAVNASATEVVGTEQKVAANLLAFGEAARGLAPTLMVTDLPNEGFLSVCTVAGLTHASVRKPSARPG